MYGKGISKLGEILDIATQLDIIHKGGAWFSYGEMRIGQGRDNAKTFLESHPDIMAEIEAKIRADERFNPAAKKKDAKAPAAPAPAEDEAPAPLAPNNGRLPKIKIDIAAD